MPTSVTYSQFYAGTYASGVFTIDYESNSPTAPYEDDGTADGSTLPGQQMYEAGFFGGPLAFVGAAGGGIVVGFGSGYYLLTDTAGLGGAQTVNTTRPFTYCYLAGTAILTPGGERAVESLMIGDLVTTHDGRAVPVRWLGCQVRDARIAQLTGGMPVRIRRGALGVDAHGAQMPSRDLCVSPDHALLVDGLLVHAEALVNGTSITRVKLDELAEVAYYHVETADHDLIVADGAPAETFIDNVSREQFDNHAEWLALYPDAPAMRELPLGRVKLARQLPRRIAERLAAVAATLPADTAAPRVA